MIVIRVGELMARHKLTKTTLAYLTGIRPGTVSNLWLGETKRIDINHMDKLCKVLKCQPGDLFEYVPDEEEE